MGILYTYTHKIHMYRDHICVYVYIYVYTHVRRDVETGHSKGKCCT